MGLHRLPARELARMMQAREASAAEVVAAHLDAIARVNGRINAFVTLAESSARHQAHVLDKARASGESLGPLAGLPVGIKDVTPTAGLRTTWGSVIMRDHVPAKDAEVVKRLRAAGAVVIGKTNTPEFAAGANTDNALFGPTRNPWNLRMSVSGSTGGGAAALAARMVPLAEGTDFGGSLRTPAAFCGVVGLRTTPGLIPRQPAVLPWHDQSVAGPMARDAEDCALLLDAMIGFARCSPLSIPPPWPSVLEIVAGGESLRGFRLAYAPQIGRTGVDAEVAHLCRSAALALSAAGAHVEEIDADFSDGRDAFITLRGESMVGNHLQRLGRLDDLGRNLSGNIRLGLELTILDIARSEHKRAEIWHRWERLFERYDAILTPTVPVPPFPVERNYPDSIGGRTLENYMDWVAQTFLVSLAGLPAASAPAGLTAAGLPVGLQIVGPRLSEPTLLLCAKFAERVHPTGMPPEAA